MGKRQRTLEVIGLAEYKLVIWDVDGTLLDTSIGLLESTSYIIEKEGLPSISEEVLKSFAGPRIQDSLNRVYGLTGEELKRISDEYREHYKSNNLFKAELYLGIVESIETIKRDNITQSVVTNKRQDLAEAILEKFGLSKYMCGIFGTDPAGRFTKTDLLRRCVEESGVLPSEAVMIGDSKYDAIAARDAGVDFIGVTYGLDFKSRQAIEEYDPVFVADSPCEIPEGVAGGCKLMDWNSESEAREQIKEMVAEYYRRFKAPADSKDSFKPGDRISYASRVYDEREMQALTDAMLDFWLTTGRFADEFEREFAKWIGVRFAHLVNSGSSANLIAFSVLTAPELKERQIRRGDEVITVACGFPTTVAPIIQYGAVPVFVDVTVPQYNIDVTMLESALSAKTKAVMIAHTLGNPFDLKEVKAFCDKHNLWLVEDNCDALGSEYTIEGVTKFTGTWGDIGTSSFYPPHHMTMGEGGCVYTSDPLLNKLILSYRDWGRDCVCPSGKDGVCGHRFDGQFGELPAGYDHKYTYSHFGYNLKVTDMQAAVGVEQLKKFPSFIERRKHNWQRLKAALEEAGVTDRLILPEPAANSDPSWFGFLISVKEDAGVTRNEMTRYIESKNIQTRLLFSGNLVKHPCFDEIRGTDAYRVVGDLKVTDFVMNNSFWVGVYPGMTDAMIDHMASVICEAANR